MIKNVWNLELQVELFSRDSKGMVDVRYVLTLQEQVLSTEIEISNSGTTPVQLSGSILSHLNVSTPDATYALGLEGSDFFKRPPFSSNFRIVPPEFDQKSKLDLGKLWEKFTPRGFTSGNDYGMEDEMEGEEDDNYKRLTDEMSLIYTSAPTNLTIIDRVWLQNCELVLSSLCLSFLHNMWHEEITNVGVIICCSDRFFPGRKMALTELASCICGEYNAIFSISS